jgi:hypothetical protein
VGARAWRGSVPPPGQTAQPEVTQIALGTQGNERSLAPADEVTRLRGELKKKDELVRALLVSAATRDAEPGSAATDQQASAATLTASVQSAPEPQPAELLDERLLMAPKDPRRTAELDRALHEAIDDLPFGDAKVSAFECAPSLCKVVFEASSPNGGVNAVNMASDKLPKLFASSVAYHTSNGSMAMYFGRTAEDTEVSLE